MSTKDVYQLAGVQMAVRFADPRGNTSAVIEHLHETSALGVDLTIFPECALSGYCFADPASANDAALDADSTELQRLVECCRDLNCAAVVGFLERTETGLQNTVVLMGKNGWIARYHKVHLPKLGVDRFTQPGSQPFNVVDYQGLRIGLLICYDCSFPESVRVLALAGADIVILPTNWPSTSGLTADYVPNCRALENNIYFAAINRVGNENGFQFIGKSKICAPTGADLAFADHDRPETLYAEVRPSIARQKRLVHVPGQHEIDRFADRRPNFYQTLAE